MSEKSPLTGYIQPSRPFVRCGLPPLSPLCVLFPTTGARSLQCQAQLRTLTEQRSKLRELFLREKEQEARLTASRLESARAEAVAENKAAELERLRGSQVRGVMAPSW